MPIWHAAIIHELTDPADAAVADETSSSSGPAVAARAASLQRTIATHCLKGGP